MDSLLAEENAVKMGYGVMYMLCYNKSIIRELLFKFSDNTFFCYSAGSLFRGDDWFRVVVSGRIGKQQASPDEGQQTGTQAEINRTVGQ